MYLYVVVAVKECTLDREKSRGDIFVTGSKYKLYKHENIVTRVELK